MHAANTLIVSALLAMALPTIAAPTTLDFESVAAATTLLADTDLYQNLGISFSAGGYGVASEKAKTAPGEGNFYRGLDANGNSLNRGAVYLWDGTKNIGSAGKPSFVINVKDGFNEDFFLSYTSADLVSSGNVQIFGEADGLGEDLGGFALKSSGTGGCFDGYLCNWNDEKSSIAKGKVGKSVVITGGNGFFYLDDFKFNLLGGSTPVPEPGGLALSLAALAALAGSRAKRQVI